MQLVWWKSVLVFYSFWREQKTNSKRERERKQIKIRRQQHWTEATWTTANDWLLSYMTVLNSMPCRFLGDIHSHFRLFDVLISVLCYFVTCPIIVDMRMIGTLSDHQKDLQRKARKSTKRRTVQSYQTDDDHHAGTRSHNTQTEKISISLERERNPMNMSPVFFHVMHDAIRCAPVRSRKTKQEKR